MHPVLEIRLPSESARAALLRALTTYTRLSRADFLVLDELTAQGLIGDRAQFDGSGARSALEALSELLSADCKPSKSLSGPAHAASHLLEQLGGACDRLEVPIDPVAPALVHALELYVRIGTGQLEAIADDARLGLLVDESASRKENVKGWLKRMERAEALLYQVKADWLGLPADGNWGIHSNEVHKDFSLVWSLVKGIREQLLMYAGGRPALSS